jgi:hypothetical protein
MAQRIKTCIFCGRTPLSEEHVWPEWCHDYVRKRTIGKSYYRKQYETSRENNNRPREVFSVETPKNITDHTLKVVCKNHCNSGWMSGLETKAKRFLIPLISGQYGVVDRYRQEIIANWIAMKLLVCECSIPEDMVFNSMDRSIFMGRRWPPDSMSIWIGRYTGDGWANTYLRSAVCAGWAPVGTLPKMPPSGSFAKNLQAQTFLIGELFVHATSTTIEGLFASTPPTLAHVLKRIWPYEGPFLWPFGRGLSDPQVALVTTAFSRFVDRLPWAGPGPASGGTHNNPP